MTEKKCTLLDVSTGTWIDALRITAADVGSGAAAAEIAKRTLHGGLCDGVDVVRLNNGRLSFDVVPTRGMGLWNAWIDGQELGWRSPVRGPVHPRFVPLMEPGGLGWLDGFDELLVRCGLESNGAPDFDDRGRLVYPLHGRIANRPAHQVAAEFDGRTGRLSVTGVVEETRFHFTKLRMTSTYTTHVGESSVTLHDEIENFSGAPATMQLLYHVNFGEPLLDAGSRFVAAFKKVVPRDMRAAQGIATWNRYAAPAPDYAEECYFLELVAEDDGQSQVLLRNAEGTRGVSIFVDTRQLPCFTLWKNTVASPDGHATGLEPGTNFPNTRTFEGKQGRVVKLAPGGKVSFDLRLEFLRTSVEVAKAEKAIQVLQGLAERVVHDKPQPGWCVV
jgi:hypothetical protein